MLHSGWIISLAIGSREMRIKVSSLLHSLGVRFLPHFLLAAVNPLRGVLFRLLAFYGTAEYLVDGCV